MDCIQQKVGLVKLSFFMSAVGSVITSQTFTLPTDRGDGYAVDMTVANNTITTVDGILITASIDGMNIFENVPAIDYSPLFTNKCATKESLPFKSGSQLTLTVNNDQATAVGVYFNCYFQQKRS